MADVLTHVLVGFIISVLLSFRYDWLGPEYVTLVMVGALSPDFTKIALVVPDGIVSSLLGVPYGEVGSLGWSSVIGVDSGWP